MKPNGNSHDRPGGAEPPPRKGRVPAQERIDTINPDRVALPVGDRTARQAFIHARVSCLMAVWRLQQRAARNC